VVIHEPVLEISCGQTECAQTHRHTDRHTPMTTRPCGLRRAGKNSKQQHYKTLTKPKLRERERGQIEPGLVAFYAIQSGNGAGLYLQPRSPHGAAATLNNLLTL